MSVAACQRKGYTGGMGKNHVTFGQRLCKFREAAGLSQAQLADKIGVHRQFIYRMEKDVHAPNWKVVCALADALGVTPNDFR